ncbi:MAG: hypothetical protein ABMA01_21335, partial [Chthoniobacteraceae bacterium]
FLFFPRKRQWSDHERHEGTRKEGVPDLPLSAFRSPRLPSPAPSGKKCAMARGKTPANGRKDRIVASAAVSHA